MSTILCKPTFLVTAFVGVLPIIGSGTLHAGGGFGSVVDQATHNSITIKWSDPPPQNFRHCAFPPRYEICWKEARKGKGACQENRERTSQKPHTIPNLESDTPYKIKVFTLSEKRRRPGRRFRNCKFRKVGTTTVSTDSPSFRSNLTPAGSGPQSFLVRLEYSRPRTFDFYRICYRQTWGFYLPFALLRDYCLTRTSSGQHNRRQGFVDIIKPTVPSVTLGWTDLAGCRQYKIVAYGFNPGFPEFIMTKIGETKMKTEGRCRFFSGKRGLLQGLTDDHDRDTVAQQYLDVVHVFYGADGILQHLADRHPILGRNLLRETAIFEADGEDLDDEVSLFIYLLEQHPFLVHAWQAETELVNAGLDVDQWLKYNHPQLHADLQEEVGLCRKKCF